MRVYPLLVIAAQLLGCSTSVDVEEFNGAIERVPPWEPPSAYVATGECSNEDSAIRESYENWRRQTNDFGVLLGTRWEGVVENELPLVIEFHADGTGAVIFDESFEPDAAEMDQEYLCGQDDCEDVGEPRLGVPYPIHGALQARNRLFIDLYGTSPWREWCELQTPVSDPDVVTEPLCQFVAESSLANGICACSSDGCFPSESGAPYLSFELVMDGYLIGTLDGNRQVGLVRVDENGERY